MFNVFTLAIMENVEGRESVVSLTILKEKLTKIFASFKVNSFKSFVKVLKYRKMKFLKIYFVTPKGYTVSVL